ncbi:ATP-binding cassette domain-containing protein, partial [Zhenhengia sp.]
ILSGEIDSSTGEVSIPSNIRMSVLKQDHYQYDECQVLETVIRGNARLYEIMQEKEALYAKEDFTDEDGVRASELEGEFAEMNGWEAESEASQLLQGLGVGIDLHYNLMKDLNGGDKVKVLLAQALFGQPGILLLDEPTNHLDIQSVNWLEDFLLDFPGTVIVVSHDRHFLNTVCTHTVDIDYGKIKMYVGNYDFWYESSQMIQSLMKAQNKKNEDKIKELQNFITRFSANKSKSKQATSRRKMLDKISLEEMPASSRRYPFVAFNQDREVGNEILYVENVSKTIDGVKVLDNVTFRVNKEDKIAIIGEDEIGITALFKILAGEEEPDTGTVKWGVTTSTSYFPKDNSEYFNDCDLDLINWLRQYSDEKSESYLRGFLGRMLFAGEDALKPAKVLSGGEKVRCMLSRMMLAGSNVLLLDQPTNHLDLESITALNNGLINFKGNVLFTSHDHQFIQTVSNRIIEIKTDGIVDRMMSYDDYLEQKNK